jgi:hypothetical protein
MYSIVTKCKSGSQLRIPALVTALALLLLGTAGCVDPADPLPVVVWEADLVPDGDASSVFLTGQAAMVANQIDSQLGIGVSLLEAGISAGWRIRQGSCGAPGQPVAADNVFPPLVPNSEGDATADIRIFQRVPPERSYMAEVFLVDAGTEDRLACGEMIRGS